MNIEKLRPLRGWVLGEAILGRYETESGILVVKDLKRNPNISKIKVLKIGGAYSKKGKAIPYCAQPGDTAWIKRAHHKSTKHREKFYCFVRNEDIVAVVSEPIAATPS